jgi:hypothetical protein
MLAKVREQVVPEMTRRGPIEVWIIDDTAFPKKGTHSVGGASSVLRAAWQAGQLPGYGHVCGNHVRTRYLYHLP